MEVIPPPPDPTASPLTFEPPPPPRSIQGLPQSNPKRAPRPTVAGGTIFAIVAGAFVANLAVQAGVAAAVTPLAVTALVAILVRHDQIQTRNAKALGGMAILTSLWLPIRASDWLTTLNALTVVGLVGLAVVIGRASLTQLHPAMFGPLIARATRFSYGPSLLARSTAQLAKQAKTKGGGRARDTSIAVARGLGIAIVPLLPIVVLLASADAVFASLLHLPVDGDAVIIHLGITLVMSVGVAGLFAVGLGPQPELSGTYRRPLGPTEATVLLVGLITVFAVFALTQLTTALGGADHILETANLTRAEYARQGFFQLLAVSIITLVALFGVRMFATISTQRVNFRLTALSVVASALTLVVVVVSVIRLSLYVDAFGFTMLRLHSMLFAGLIAAVFALYVCHLVVPASRLWFLPAVGLVAWGLLIGLNGLNPERFVTNWNIEHQTTIYEFDASYAAGLSADAIPTMVSAFDSLEVAQQNQVRSRLCAVLDQQARWGALGWNRSIEKAQNAVLAGNTDGSLACR